jgi:hypothetical protein
MSLSKSKIIHIIIEAFLIIALGTYCIINLNKLKNRVSNLERELEAQRTRTNVLEAAVQEILNAQHPAVQKRVSAIVSNTSTMRQPSRVQAQPVATQPSPVVQAKPPPANPFDSIMSMMAPMMSSMIVGGGDDDESVASIAEIPDDISDADISDELNELKETPRQPVKNNTVEIEEVESDDEVELDLTADEVATELNLQVEEVKEEVKEDVKEEVKEEGEMGQD